MLTEDDGGDPGLRERRRRETCAEISSAASALFERQRFAADTVAGIAREAGISIGRSTSEVPSSEDSAGAGTVVADKATFCVSGLSAVAQDYLKVIWNWEEWGAEKISTKILAGKLGVSSSTASETIRRLVDQELVVHKRYGTITLTAVGRMAAVLMVRRHRLLETFLLHELGYGWDEVHDEAEVLEHAVSDKFMSRLDAKLGHPTRDPHGDPIPAPDGSVRVLFARPLADFEVGEGGAIARIADSDPEMLRYFDSVGMALDRVIVVRECRPFAGTIEISIDGRNPLVLGDIAARAIWLTDI